MQGTPAEGNRARGGCDPTFGHNGGSCPDVPCSRDTASHIVLALSEHSLSFAMTNP
jgi:hypothetical protein